MSCDIRYVLLRIKFSVLIQTVAAICTDSSYNSSIPLIIALSLVSTAALCTHCKNYYIAKSDISDVRIIRIL